MGHLSAAAIQKYHLWGGYWSHEMQNIPKLLECLSARESVFHQLPDLLPVTAVSWACAVEQVLAGC